MKSNKYNKTLTIFSRVPLNVPLEIYHSDPYKALISTVLSSRTKDETTLSVCKNLFKKAPDIRIMSNLDTDKLSESVYPVGFYKTKAKNLKLLTKMILEEFNGKIPSNRKDLMRLPGVGRKTANLVLNRAFDKPAIAVDTHVHRISNLLGWVNTKTPEQTEIELMDKVPKKYWSEINRQFVSVGRTFNSKSKLDDFLRTNGLI